MSSGRTHFDMANFCRVLEIPFKFSETLNLLEKSLVWLLWQLLKDIKQLMFKYLEKPQTSSGQNKTLFADIFILILFRKVVLKLVRVTNVWD